MATAVPGRRRKLLRRGFKLTILGLSLAALVFGPSAIESAMSHYVRFRFRRQFAKNVARVARFMNERRQDTGLNPVLTRTRASKYPTIPYELIPGIDVCSKYAEVIQLNKDGFRTNTLVRDYHQFAPRHYETGRLPNGITIALIGDSIAFGEGVSNGQNYASLFEGKLRKGRSMGTRVINSGVPGYNTAVEVEVLKYKLLKYSPDVILVGFCGNDADLPHYTNFDALELLKKRRPGGVPEWYYHMRGWASVEAAFGRLRDIARSAGVPVEILLDCTFVPPSLPDDPDEYLGDANKRVIAYSKENGFGTIDPFPGLIRDLKQTGREPEEYWVNRHSSPPDAHPNPRKHQLIAAAIYAAFERKGYIAPVPGE